MLFSEIYRPVSLDNLKGATGYRFTRADKLRGNEARSLMDHILGRMFMSSLFDIHKGRNPFFARTQVADATLGASLGLCRRWICELKDRLVAAQWFVTRAPRRRDGTQEITVWTPGKKLKRVLVMLTNSPQHRRVHDAPQKLPTKEDVAKNLQFLRGLQQEIAEKMAMNKKTRR